MSIEQRFKRNDQTLTHIEVLGLAHTYLPNEDFFGFDTRQLEGYLAFKVKELKREKGGE